MSLFERRRRIARKGLIVNLFFLAALGFYLWVRITKTLDLGPYRSGLYLSGGYGVLNLDLQYWALRPTAHEILSLSKKSARLYHMPYGWTLDLRLYSTNEMAFPTQSRTLVPGSKWLACKKESPCKPEVRPAEFQRLG